MHTGPFTLVKWYMDCVTDAGEAAIVYCADLRWSVLHASIGSVLESGAGVPARTRTSLSGFRIASATEDISVQHKRLGVTGTWSGVCPGVRRSVYEEGGGSIVWNCVQPGSRVRMRVKDREFAGLGYAECLTLTLPSWRLPIRCLRWGRFVSEEHALAWVDWQGSYSTRFAVLDGRECALESASELEVIAEGAVLKIERGEWLRAGQLSSTIVPGAPGLKRLFPASLFNIREQKWKSRGALACGGQTSHGWVIHEVVEWEP